VSMVNSGCKPDARWITHMEMGWAQEWSQSLKNRQE
jgi:hypothetical protein